MRAPSICWRSPIIWSGAASGSSAATAGPTTSAPPAWTTCWPAGDVNILVLDTEVYSNTGGQASKSTPMGAVAKFAAAGKQVGKKDLALQAISYGNVYVARIAMGANPQQTLLAFPRSRSLPGPSLILAYSHCIAHGINMQHGLDQQQPGGGKRALAADPFQPGGARHPVKIRSCSTRRGRGFR
jgi:hypothetical protein